MPEVVLPAFLLTVAGLHRRLRFFRQLPNLKDLEDSDDLLAKIEAEHGQDPKKAQTAEEQARKKNLENERAQLVLAKEGLLRTRPEMQVCYAKH